MKSVIEDVGDLSFRDLSVLRHDFLNSFAILADNLIIHVIAFFSLVFDLK